MNAPIVRRWFGVLALGVFLGSVGCQFVAGIANEKEGCPIPKGDTTTFPPSKDCTEYCSTTTTTTCIAGKNYPDVETCLAVCSTLSSGVPCRRTSAALACNNAGPYDCDSKPLDVYRNLFAVVCKTVSTQNAFDPSTNGKTLILATQAARVGCTESAECLCKEAELGKGPAAAKDACAADYDACQTACKLPNWNQ